MTDTTTVIGGQQSPQRLLDKVMHAAIAGDITTLMECKTDFLSIPANLAKCVDKNGNTLTHLAVRKDPSTLKFIIEEYGAPIDAVNAHGKTALHLAVTENHVKCTEYLLSAGARDNIFTFAMSSPFHTAASCGAKECLDLLLQRAPADKRKERVNEADKFQRTALHKCAHDGGIRVVQWLLDHGADVNHKDGSETTPLLVAAKMGRLDVCELLISRGADVQHIDASGNSALHYAASKCLPDIFDLLVANGAPMLDQNVEGNTPLHLLFMNPRVDHAGWEPMACRMVREGGQPLLNAKNAALKKPVDYLSRELQPLFTLERVQQLEAEKAQAKELAAERVKNVKSRKEQLIAARKAQLEEIENQKREERERIMKDLEERRAAEDEARSALDDEAEAKRLEEEELKKKKKEKAKKGK